MSLTNINPLTSSACAVSALAAVSCVLAPTTSAAQTLQTQSMPTKMAAYGPYVVWSRYDTATKRFRLVRARADGPPATFAIKSRRVPFDVSLGPGSGHHVLATYSRCSSERARYAQEPTYLPLWEQQRGCRLYQLDLASGHERRILRERARPGDSDFLPSIWGHHLAFVRSVTGPRTRAGREGPDQLRLLDLESGRVRILAGGPRGIGGAHGDPLYPTGPGALDTSLRGTQLSYRWGYYAAQNCPGADPQDELDPFVSRLQVVSPGRHPHVLAQACAQTDPSLVILGDQTATGFDYATTLLFKSRDHSTVIHASQAGEHTSMDPALGQAFITSMAVTNHVRYISAFDPVAGVATVLRIN